MKKALPDHSGSAFFKTTVVHLSDLRLCGSGLARDELQNTVFTQPIRVFVNDHREQARSHI